MEETEDFTKNFRENCLTAGIFQCLVIKSCGNNKPPVWEWSMPPIHGDSGDGLLVVMVLLLSGWWFLPS